MASSTSIIPVLDFAKYDTDKRNDLAEEICQTLRTVGFMYLKNHGVPDIQTDKAFEESRKFFQLPEGDKKATSRPQGALDASTGYVQIGAEQTLTAASRRLNPNTRKEIREAFDYKPNQPMTPDLIPALHDLDQSLRQLASRILQCIAIGLHLDDEHYFEKCHENLFDDTHAGTMFRSLYYPPFVNDSGDPKVVRLGSHSDYGTVTLLMQDNVGGLEVLTTGDVFVPATPIPGTVLVNIGDILQRWTADELRATKHRVLCNESQQSRQSLVIFVHPDADHMVSPLDGSGKYPPIRAHDHLIDRYKQAYS